MVFYLKNIFTFQFDVSEQVHNSQNYKIILPVVYYSFMIIHSSYKNWSKNILFLG